LIRGSKPKLDESKVADQMNVLTPNFISTSVSFAVDDENGARSRRGRWQLEIMLWKHDFPQRRKSRSYP
jgi:hypothetical protein